MRNCPSRDTAICITCNDNVQLSSRPLSLKFPFHRLLVVIVFVVQLFGLPLTISAAVTTLPGGTNPIIPTTGNSGRKTIPITGNSGRNHDEDGCGCGTVSQNIESNDSDPNGNAGYQPMSGSNRATVRKSRPQKQTKAAVDPAENDANESSSTTTKPEPIKITIQDTRGGDWSKTIFNALIGLTGSILTTLLTLRLQESARKKRIFRIPSRA